MKVPYVNLPSLYLKIKNEILTKIDEVLSSGKYIFGDYVQEFERKFADYCGVKYAIGVNSGTDALILALKAYGIGNGDEIITAPNSFLASASCIALTGAKPVFVDVRDDFNINLDLIEEAITSKTKAIIPVHLTGKPADMDKINKIAQKYNLKVIEDAAQAFGAKYKDNYTGNLGDAGCFSFHVLKNLHCYGDGGIITSNDENVYDYLIKARNHGLSGRCECDFWSVNSRLDAVQAAVLSVKMNYIDSWIERRRKIASYYIENLKEVVNVPFEKAHEKQVYTTFMIKCKNRNELQKYLLDNGVDNKVHYEIPIHLMKAGLQEGYKLGDFPVTEKLSKEILSLPIYPELTDEQVDYVVSKIRGFYE